MNNLLIKPFLASALTVLFLSTLFSQDRFPERVPDPVSIKDQFRHQFLEERFYPERPFNRLGNEPDFRNDHRPWLDKERLIEDDSRRRFDRKRPSLPSIYNKQMLYSTWVNSWKNTYTYDANKNRTEDLGQYWENNAWVNSWKNTYTYDANGNMTELLGQYWENNAWVNGSKNTYTYDANGNMTEELGHQWMNNAWVNGSKNTYTYDANGNRTELLGQDWENNAWVNSWKATIIYDANGNRTELLWQDWEDNAWVNSSKRTYIYDANGNRTELLIQQWENNAWVNSWKRISTYDANGNMTEALGQRWENNAWVNSSKNTYTYDANWNMTELLIQQWENNAWVNSWKFTLTYDANGNMTEWLGQRWEVPLTITYGNTLPEAFKLSQNYPNPFNPITKLSYDLPEQSHVSLVIYDLLGREVRTLVNQYQYAGFKSVIWNATNDNGKPVSAGVFLYQIKAHQKEGGKAGEFVQVKKMVLLK